MTKFALFALALSALISIAHAEPTTMPTTRPTLYLIGDSTVRNGTVGQRGWGEAIGGRFDATKIDVQNRAIGGRSSRTFLTEGRWDDVLKTLKPDDFVMMQFGHNDSAVLSGDNRERGTIKGVGDETQDVTLTLGANKGKKETVHTFGWYMTKYVEDTKAKGATPIVISYVPRCPRAGEKISPPGEPGSYWLWAKQVAEKEKVPFIDLHSLVRQKWIDDKLTAEQIKAELFSEADYTHTNAKGAAYNAERVIEGLKGLDTPLKTFVATP